MNAIHNLIDKFDDWAYEHPNATAGIMTFLDAFLTVIAVYWMVTGKIVEGLLIFIYMEVRDLRLGR